MAIPYKEYLIITPTPEYYEGLGLRAVVRTQQYEGEQVLNITALDNPIQPGDRLVFGCDAYTREMIEPLDEALYEALRPLGNSPDGSATDALAYATWAGVGLRKLGDAQSADTMTQLYPGTPPFEVMVAHYWYEQAEFSGYGFLAEITGGADSRDPSARAMAVYSDPECTQYLWTGGAYQLGPSRLGQVDEEGVPLQVWFSDTPPGQRTAQEEEWHLACLFGSAQEGHATLPIGGELLLQFWDRDQGQSPGGSEWVDTGATVIAQAGTLYRISDAGVAASLTPGQAIKFTESGTETTFTGVWAGGADYIEIDPFVQAVVGDALWAYV